MIKNRNILITGGAGFIGSHLFESLIKIPNFVIIIDNFRSLHSENEKNIKAITNNYEIKKDYDLIRGDLVDSTILKDIHYDIDYIFHIAAIPGVRYSIHNAEEVTRNNIVSSVNVFEYALEVGVKKVIYASSSSIYGNPLYTPVDEDHPKNPISPYAVSKLCGEIYADYYYTEHKLPVTILRFYTVYGPRGRPDMAISKFFANILKNKTIQIYGDGKQIRDFTYISDIVQGLILSAEKKNSIGEIFNLGCSNPIVINNLVEKMYTLAKKTKQVNYIEKQKGDVEITHSKIEKARKLLGFKPEVDIDTGLKNTYEWQKQNK
ncbi:MAG: NAD-dependent epimerase/dehydratase family protein [Promethearchaeota archaeon]